LLGAVRKGTLHKVRDRIVAAYEEQLNYHPNPAAIGHSLGTFAIGSSLQSLPDLVLHRIILYGSILPRRFPWLELAKRKQVEHVLNEAARNDIWPKVAACLRPAWGRSGCDGFLNGGEVVIQREYLLTGHSGLQYRLHYKRIWIPFLRGRDIRSIP
jgi:hypothetical protein